MMLEAGALYTRTLEITVVHGLSNAHGAQERAGRQKTESRYKKACIALHDPLRDDKDMLLFAAMVVNEPRPAAVQLYMHRGMPSTLMQTRPSISLRCLDALSRHQKCRAEHGNVRSGCRCWR